MPSSDCCGFCWLHPSSSDDAMRPGRSRLNFAISVKSSQSRDRAGRGRTGDVAARVCQGRRGAVVVRGADRDLALLRIAFASERARRSSGGPVALLLLSPVAAWTALDR